MKRILATIVFLSILVTLTCSDNPVENNADMVTVSGFVYQSNNETYSKIPNVTIKFDDYSTKSDSVGKFVIDVLKGEYEPICIHPLGDTFINSQVEIVYDREIDLFTIGPTFTIAGNISNSTDGNLDSVKVTTPYSFTYTNQDGYYQFLGYPIGKYPLKIEKDFYYTIRDTIEIINENISKLYTMIRPDYSFTGVVKHRSEGFVAGAEIMLDSLYFDTTDNEGRFAFDGLKFGNHFYSYNHPDYNNGSGEFYIINGNYYSNIVVTKNIIDTLWVEEDASTYFNYFDSSGIDNNYGDLSTLGISHYILSEYIMNQPEGSFSYWVKLDENSTTSYMKLPQIPNISYDSVLLVLTSRESSYFRPLFSVEFAALTENWNEETITYQNAPSPSGESIDIMPHFYGDPLWKINITDLTEIFCTPNGFRMEAPAFWSHFDEVDYYWYVLFSSEYDDINKRPMVLVYSNY